MSTFYLLISILFLTQVTSEVCSDLSCMLSSNSTSESFTTVLSRKRRYLVFPEGSSFSMAACMTVGWYGNQYNSYIDWAANWGISYNLPNETYQQSLRRKIDTDMPRSIVQRRFRRDLYKQVENAFQGVGQNGRECVLRAVCESNQLFGSKGSTMIEEMLRTLFMLPSSKVLPFEHPDLHLYDKAYKNGKGRTSCGNLYPKCGFSLHEMALGGYSKPQM